MKPELLSANVNYKTTDTIQFILYGYDKNFSESTLTANDITITIDGVTVIPTTKTFATTQSTTSGIYCLLTVGGFSTTGQLGIQIGANTLKDAAGFFSDAASFDTKVEIIPST